MIVELYKNNQEQKNLNIINCLKTIRLYRRGGHEEKLLE